MQPENLTPDDQPSLPPIGDPRREIERLEARIEALGETVVSCRKFMLGARVAIIAGAVWLLAMLTGLLWLDALRLLTAITLVLGGMVFYGSNRSTLDVTLADMREAEARRAKLIGAIDLRLVD